MLLFGLFWLDSIEHQSVDVKKTFQTWRSNKSLKWVNSYLIMVTCLVGNKTNIYSDNQPENLWKCNSICNVKNNFFRNCNYDNRTNVLSRSSLGVYYDIFFDEKDGRLLNHSRYPKDCNELLKNGIFIFYVLISESLFQK